jgi:hypothetical protein
VTDAGDGRSPLYPLLQSEQADARSRTGRQMRREGIGTGRTAKTAPSERQEEDQEAPFALKGVLRHALTRHRESGTGCGRPLEQTPWCEYMDAEA